MGRTISVGLTLVSFVILAFLIARLEGVSNEKLSGKPYVVDGDSLVLDEINLRLMGIDAPELDQQCKAQGQPWPCGAKARAALRNKVKGAQIYCTTWGEDRYQRLLAICSVGKTEINAWLVRTGWAVDYGGYAREEGEARRNKVGIWRGDFENPGEWRKAHKSQASSVPHTMPNWLAQSWAWVRGIFN